MALTGEAKREWRRKNREKIRAYTQEWLARNPEFTERQKAKAEQKKQAEEADRIATDPDYAARWLHESKMETDPEYAASHFELVAERTDERRRIANERRRSANYTGGWTWKSVGLIVSLMRAHYRQQTTGMGWDRRAQNIARSLRFMKSLTCSPVRLRKRKKRGWMGTAALLAYRLNSNAAQARDKRQRTAWMYRAARIAGNLRMRSRS